MSLGKRLQIMSAALLAVLLCVWAVFYAVLSSVLEQQTQEITEKILGYMLGEMESRFAGMEQLSSQMTASSSMAVMLETDDIRAYAAATQAITDSLLLEPAGMLTPDNLIVFRDDGSYFRFRGALSGADCERAYRLVSRMPLNRHTVLELGSSQYLGYGNRVDTAAGRSGVILMLLDRDKIMSDMQLYVEGTTIQAALAADGEIVVATTPELVGSYVGARSAGSVASFSQRVQNTPFEVVVFSENELYGQVSRQFLMLTIITVLLFALAVSLFLIVLQRQLFRPVVDTVRNIEQVSEDGVWEPVTLPQQGSVELRSLIDRFNALIRGLSEKDRAIYETDLRRQQAEIYALKRQINAHFTVNVLNVIKRMNATGDTQAASRVIDALSHLIRYAYSDDEYISIMDELFILEQYIDVMRYRYHADISFDYELDDSLYEYTLPRMLLQPLVENAIVHGFAPPAHPGHIAVTVAARDDGWVTITVRDDGHGLPPERLETVRAALRSDQGAPPTGISGVALANTLLRLRAFYGPQADLTIDAVSGGGTVVALTCGPIPPDR